MIKIEEFIDGGKIHPHRIVNVVKRSDKSYLEIQKELDDFNEMMEEIKPFMPKPKKFVYVPTRWEPEHPPFRYNY